VYMCVMQIAEACGRCGKDKGCHPGSKEYPAGEW
jgi:hypothetical protein